MDFADQLMAAAEAELFVQHAEETYTKFKGNSFKVALVINANYTFSHVLKDAALDLDSTSETDILAMPPTKRRKYMNRIRSQYLANAIREIDAPNHKPRLQRGGRKAPVVDIPHEKTKIVYIEYSNLTKGLYDLLAEVIKKMTDFKMMPHTGQMREFIKQIVGINIPDSIYVETLYVTYNIGFYHRQHALGSASLYISDVKYEFDNVAPNKCTLFPKYKMEKVGTDTHRCIVVSDLIPQIVEQMEIFNNTKAAKAIAVTYGNRRMPQSDQVYTSPIIKFLNVI